jgi:hypothetical protein
VIVKLPFRVAITTCDVNIIAAIVCGAALFSAAGWLARVFHFFAVVPAGKTGGLAPVSLPAPS